MAGLADTAAIQRQLQIKTGEESSYLTEAKEQEARIQKFVDDGRDVYDVKQQRSVLADTLKMIPDCRKRLQLAADELAHYIQEGVEETPDIPHTPEYTSAKQVLADTLAQLHSPAPSA
ncbi:related to related to Tubulin-specific chaperone A [Sporisorium reilianum SRZ2]|uniref:Tubulin-specific chaperone A n=1 Tax=Sporisorium reilianum (strain SRZ2) TaxID=999809 RepID=E6ZTX6_SPORE|nr:related to related to Tubulin-specific chaperone A [Sporisorium reilianum SRZ2]